MSEGGRKDDSQKPRMDLLPTRALVGAAKVLTFGATKYDPHNWRKGIALSRLMGAAFRHGFAFNDGEDLDPESSLLHLYHMMVNIMFAIEMYETRTDLDDRYTTLRKQGMTKAIDTLCTAAKDSSFIRSEK